MHYFNIGSDTVKSDKEIFHYCNVNLPKVGAITETTIRYYDLTFVLEGRMIYFADGERFELKEGDAIFLVPGTKRAREASSTAVHFVSFNFTSCDTVMPGVPPLLEKCIGPEIRRLCEVYPFAHLSGFGNARDKCGAVLEYILSDIRESLSGKPQNRHVTAAVSHVESNLTARLSLSETASAIGITKEYLSSLFRQHTGKRFTDYVIERKMLLARELIAEGNMTMAEIGEHLGFENYNYFSRMFKRTFEVSPVKFKMSVMR